MREREGVCVGEGVCMCDGVVVLDSTSHTHTIHDVCEKSVDVDGCVE